MSIVTFAKSTTMTDPFAMAIRYLTEPYGRGSGTQTLRLGAAAGGVWPVVAYHFGTFSAKFGVQSGQIDVSYVLTLLDDQINGPAVVTLGYVGVAGPGTVDLVVPAGSLAGMSFAIVTLPVDPTLVLTTLTERPLPASGQPSGGDRWSLTALLGNVARLLWVQAGEAQNLAATARDVARQFHLLSARGASLDKIGAALGVARMLPSPYRLDLDPHTVALFHLDDAIAPVLDATHDHPGTNVGAARGQTDHPHPNFQAACRITPAGGIRIPDALAFVLDPSVGFTVELFVFLTAAPAAQETLVFAVKRPRFDQTDAPGWSLAFEPSGAGHDLAFTLTDAAGNLVRAAKANAVPLNAWVHLAGVVNPATKLATVLVNGVVAGSAPLGSLGVIANGADIGLGADRTGASHFSGEIDEVRFSNVARTDFSRVLGAGAAPYAVDLQTIALYHLDESDDTIDEDRGLHFAKVVNTSANRGVAGRFGGSLQFEDDPLPHSHCGSERSFQSKLRAGNWSRVGGGAPVKAGPYARFGYLQSAISEIGLTGVAAPVLINDLPTLDLTVRGRISTACYGFAPSDPVNPNNPQDPATTITKFQAAGRSVQEAIDYFGEWFGLNAAWFANAYQTNGIVAAHEPCQPPAPSPASVLIPGSAEFAFGAGTSFTVEAFINPDPTTDSYPRAVIASRSTALRVGEPNANEAGWALVLGPFRSIPNNLRWVVGDALGAVVTVDANADLADGTFHHVAGVVDRDVGVAMLFVDGIQVGQSALGAMGAVSTAGGITLGNAPDLTAPYAGLIDEVRISRQALRRFQPVLGESDDRYRQRLAIFRPWRLPSLPALRRGVQALTLSDPSQTDVARLLLGNEPVPTGLVQLDVVETDSTRFTASRWLRVIPQTLAPGASIAVDGTSPAVEPALASPLPLPADSPALLTLPDNPSLPGLTFANPASRIMVLATARALERLTGRLSKVASTAVIEVISAYQESTDSTVTSDNLGLAVSLRLKVSAPGVDLGTLGALAFETGIAYVAHRATANPPCLRLVVTPGLNLDLTATGANPGLDLRNRQIAVVNQPITVAIVRPKLLPINGALPALSWSILSRGPIAGILRPISVDSTVMSFTGTALGDATIEVRYPLPDGRTVLVGALAVRVAPASLDGCDILSGDGTPDVNEATVSGAPDADFTTDDLLTVADPRLDYGPSVAPASSHQMQLPLERVLLDLTTLVAKEPGSPRFTVIGAYDPGATNLQTVGRGAVIAPSGAGLTAGRLGALAFLAGCAYIERRRYPPSVYLSVPPGDRFEVVPGPLRRLWANARISGLGVFAVSEFEAAGPPDPGFLPGSLVAFSDPRAVFVGGASNLVQVSLKTTLLALLDALKADGVGGVLNVFAGFIANAPTLRGVGRAIEFRHPNVAADRLCGYALQAGFAFVEHRATEPSGPAVYAAAYLASGQPANLLRDPAVPYVNVYRDSLVELDVRPAPGIQGRLDWGVVPTCPASGELTTALPDPTAPPRISSKIFQGTSAGAVAAVATFSRRDSTEPFQFAIVPRLSADGVPLVPKLTKDQYDDLMNLLESLHPTGVEAVTSGLRQYVHGFPRPPRWDRLPTTATFPSYRDTR
jgi:hypothetical protein